MSKALSVPSVAEIVRARGLATLDVETSHKVVRAVAGTLRSMNHDLNADALNLAVSVLRNADRLPSGCTPVPTDAWRRIWALLPDEVRNSDSGMSGGDLVAMWLETALGSPCKEGVTINREVWARVESIFDAGDPLTPDNLAPAIERLTALLLARGDRIERLEGADRRLHEGVANALGVEGDPEAVDLVGIVRDLRVAKDTLLADRKRLQDLRNAEIENMRTVCAVLGTGMSSWETILHRVGALQGERDRLSAELDAMAQRAVSETAALHHIEPFVEGEVIDAGFKEEPSQQSEAAKIEAAFEGYRVEMSPSDDREASPTVAPIEGEGFEVLVPEGGAVTIEREPKAADEGGQAVVGSAPRRALPYDDKPFREKSPEEIKRELGVDPTARPVRVSLAAPSAASRVPTLDDRVEAIRRLADGEAKADIASALGLKNGTTVQGMTMHDKPFVERVRKAAPHDVDGVLAEIRKEIERSKGVASAS